MKIIVDAFGGDNAPEEILQGCAQAQPNLGIWTSSYRGKGEPPACAKELGLSPELAQNGDSWTAGHPYHGGRAEQRH